MMESSVVEGAVESESGRGNESSVVVVVVVVGRVTKRGKEGVGEEVEARGAGQKWRLRLVDKREKAAKGNQELADD